MPTREDILNEKTFKEDDFPIDQRVYYTLSGDEATRPKLQPHRNSVAIGLLFALLHKRGVLSDEDIDDILFDVEMS